MTKGGEKPDVKAHKERLAALREKTQRKIDYHLQKAFLNTGDFYHLITDFFLELLQKDYAATYEEILKELEEIEHEYLLFTKEQRGKAGKLLNALNELHYHEQKITQDQARTILQEFRNLTIEFTEFEDESVQRILHQAGEEMRKGDKAAARTAYDKANELYSRLGEDEKRRHYADMQNVYEQLQS